MDDDRLIRLQATVDDLRGTVRALERRMQALEARPGEAAQPAPEPATVATEVAGVDPGSTQKTWRDPFFVSSLVGRLFLVLAGGYFLRAMTDTGNLTPTVGVSLGFAYGLVWLVA